MATYSISKISTFETCPRQYQFAYVDNVKVEVEETIETFLGAIVHEALEKLYRDKMHEKLLSLEELIEDYRQRWAQKWPGEVILVKKDYAPENYLMMGERYLRDYYRRHHPFERGRVLGLETKELLPLDEKGDYLLHVRIDRLVDMGDGIYEIHDYKTSSVLPSEEELQGDRQLAAYALWVKQRFRDFQKARLVWHFLAFDKEMDLWRTGEELETARREILARIQEIEAAREFPAVVSRLCDWCIYRSMCPMWKHGAELEAKTENEYLDDPGVKLVDEYVRLQSELNSFTRETNEKLEKIKAALVRFCQREGVSVIFGTANKITVKEHVSFQIPAKSSAERKRLMDILRQSGQWEEVADVDVFALARAIRNREWDESLIKALEEFVKMEKGYRFILSKK